MPMALSRHDPGRPADDDVRLDAAAASRRSSWEEQVGNSLIVREPVGVVGCDHAVELPAAPDRREGRAGARRRLHGRAEAERGRAAQRVRPRRDHRRGRAARRASSTSSPARARWSARRSPRTPDVDMVSFTGSTRAGRRVSRAGGRRRVKRVALELGGKSPNVILDDADLEQAVADGVAKCFLNSGQTCSALTRMLVPREQARARPSGSPRRWPTRRSRRATRSTTARALGPLVSDAQRERVRGYIEKGAGGGRQARHRRRRAARGPRQRLLRAADRVLRRHARHDDRPGGDLRPGAVDHALRRRGRRGPDRQRLDLRPRRRRLVGRRGARQARGARASAPARSRSTAAPSTRWRRSAATSSPATAASWAATASRSSSR